MSLNQFWEDATWRTYGTDRQDSELEKVVFKCMNQLAVSMGETLGLAVTRRGSPAGFWLPVKTLVKP
jgi:hypothetical protein